MKKTKFYIYGFFGGKKPQARQVNGYFEYIDGVALGLHKPENDCVWAVTELSTGLKITDGQTRQKALDNVLEFLPQVRTEIDKDRIKKVKEIIQAAYKAG